VSPLRELLGESPQIAAVRKQVQHLLRAWPPARRPPPVLVRGETGTGKGLLARLLHRASPRASAPFVSINCAAIPEPLLEAELFGYERGAFTDARQSKPGLFRLAHRGTLFLDEIGLLPVGLQGKLLSALEDGTIRRLGATRAESADVWIVAATSEDIGQTRRFRQDLYHRLSVMTLWLPPLRDRPPDVLPLARHLLGATCREYGLPERSLAPDAIAALRAHPWPGNVRELANVVERAALLSDRPVLTAADLGLTPAAPVARRAPGPAAGAGPAARSSREVMRDHLLAALAETGWNITHTAARLGVSRLTVRARIARFGLRDGDAPPLALPAPLEAGGAAGGRADVAALRGGWHPRRLTVLRLRLLLPVGAEARAQALLDQFGDKVRSFRGRVEALSPTALTAVFGLDLVDEPAALAAHCAMVVRNAVVREQLEDGSPASVKVALHSQEILVAGGASQVLDADALQEAVAVLDRALEAAAPGSIVAAGVAASLLRRRFRLAPLGPETSTVRVEGLWHARLGGRAVVSAFAGRREELALLAGRLEAARRGHGQAVHISGDAGIGKSRLLVEVLAGLQHPPVTYLEGRCSAAALSTPLAPLQSILRGACRLEESDPPELVDKHVTQVVEEAGLDSATLGPVLIQLLAADPVPDPELDPASHRRRAFGAIQALLLGQAALTPLVIAVEDLHWTDPTSEACLRFLVDTIGGAPVLVVTTARPGYRPPWAGAPGVTQLALAPLTADESRDVVRAALGTGALSEATVSRILARADGNPLFLVELSRTAMERGEGALAAQVPATIEDVIANRIARLRPRHRQLLGAAAVIGRDVPLRVLRAVAGLSDRALDEALGQLVRADLLTPMEGGAEPHHAFKHALVQEVSYRRVGPGERRALHLRILDAVEALPGGRLAEQVEWLAHHAMHGEAWERAVRYLMQASLRAAARSAMAEAVDHVTLALGLLDRLPPSPERDRDELRLQLALGSALRVTRGYAAPETGAAYTRARSLWERVGDASQRLPVLRGQWVHHLLRGDYRVALGFGEEILAVADAGQDPTDRLEAYMALGLPAVFLGEFVQARAHLETAVGLYEPDHARSPFVLYGTDSRATCLAYLSLALCALGHPDQATARGQEAVAHAEARALPLSVAQAMTVLANVHQMRRDLAAVALWSERASTFARERGFAYWSALGEILQRWVEAERGDDAAIPRLRQGLDRYRETGAALGWSWFLWLLAKAHARTGEAREGLAVVAEALGWAEQSGEAYWVAELYRLEGLLRLMEGRPDAAAAAEACLVRSLDVARRQAARLWELRAAAALARLWLTQGLAHRGRELLAPILAGFDEGLETPDLVEARALLHELGRTG